MFHLYPRPIRAPQTAASRAQVSTSSSFDFLISRLLTLQSVAAANIHGKPDYEQQLGVMDTCFAEELSANDTPYASAHSRRSARYVAFFTVKSNGMPMNSM